MIEAAQSQPMVTTESRRCQKSPSKNSEETVEVRRLKKQIKELKKKLQEYEDEDSEEDDDETDEDYFEQDQYALGMLETMTLRGGSIKLVSPKTIR